MASRPFGSRNFSRFTITTGPGPTCSRRDSISAALGVSALHSLDGLDSSGPLGLGLELGSSTEREGMSASVLVRGSGASEARRAESRWYRPESRLQADRDPALVGPIPSGDTR